MKALLEKVRINGRTAIKVRTYTKYRLDVPYHYHPEYEIVHVLEGKGKVMIGHTTDEFKAGDVYVIGSGIPHLFVNSYFRNRKLECRTKLLVIQFRKRLLDSLLPIPEISSLSPFLNRIDQGVKIPSDKRSRQELFRLKHAHGIKRFSALISLMDDLAGARRYKTITQQSEMSRYSRHALQRKQAIHAFLLESYHRRVDIAELAAHVHLTRTSLCRFMKTKMKTTFSRLLNEIRIEHACQMLEETAYTVQRIASEAGCDNLSYFYRQFRNSKGCSPNRYREING